MVRPVIFSIIAFFILICEACSSSVNYNYEREQAIANQYKIGAGDLLYVSVWENDKFSGRVKVRPDGYITINAIGDIRAAGRTPIEIQNDIRKELKRFFQEVPAVTVTVVEVKSYYVYVLGKVRNPGRYTSTTPVTVLQALALAGGITEFANPNRIVIVRKDEHGTRRIPFVMDEVIKEGRLEMNLTLISGDTVVVP